MKPIISVEGLGKSYTIRHEGRTGYKSLREEIFKLPQRLLHRNAQSQEEFWALKDVSFDVMPGDRVGIIGRNGAGKSTLLKLLSRITEPTTGRITLRGRVASLLEVGTGFHPELSGRENIFLNGAILGMSRAEVRKKFDEIVDFAGVEKFLDTPVKRYSSGMYVRLAFAVAAHLEPEILIVDEVLAVGDAEFQKKCLGKMEDVGREGRTVLFVSHNSNAITTLCQRALLLTNGSVALDAAPHEAFRIYFRPEKKNSEMPWHKFFTKPDKPHKAWITECKTENNGTAFWGEDITVTLGYIAHYRIATPQFCIKFTNENGHTTATMISSWQETNFEHLNKGQGEVTCIIKNAQLMPGTYKIDILLWTPNEKICECPSHLTCDILWKESGNNFKYNASYGSTYIDACWSCKETA